MLEIATQDYEHPIPELNRPIEVVLDHIEYLEYLIEELKKDPNYFYCKFFYDTLLDLLMHGY